MSTGKRPPDVEPQADSDNVGEKSTPPYKASPAPSSANTPPEKKPSILDKLPPWITANLRSPRARRMLLRCWIGSWVAYVILLPQKSLNTLGNAAFFALLASFMVPANMPVQPFIFALFTMVLGMCLGWAFGAAAMRAALAARNQTVLKASLQREAQSVAGLANPDALFRSDIFEGKFLDTRSSVVFGVFLAVANFLFALMRAYAPKLLLTSIFGTVAIDIFCSYGALFPFAQYTLLNSLLTSVACYIALGLVIIIFVFPETVNHAALVSTSDLIGKTQGVISILGEILESSPEDLAPGTPLATKLQGARMAIMMHMQQLKAATKFIGAEFSWGKWNSDDVMALHAPLMAVVSRTAAFHGFTKLAGHPLTHVNPDAPESSASSTVSGSSSTFTGDTYLLRQLRMRNHAAETEHNVRLADVMSAIDDATVELRQACARGLGAVKAVLDGINTRRYSRSGAPESEALLNELDEAFDHLRRCLLEFRTQKRLALVQPFQAMLDRAQAGLTSLDADVQGARHGHAHSLPLRSLYISYVFAANLIVLSEAIVSLMTLVQTTAAKRKVNRLWAPGGLKALVRLVFSRGGEEQQGLGEDLAEPDEEEKKKVYRLDPDSRPPQNSAQRVAGALHAVYKWTKTPEALFTFRYVILSIVCWIPAVVKHSAHFIYVQKGLWALIMAQTTLNIYASDQIYNYVIRILGTLGGALLGCLGWYIGSANGNGSPYGSAAVVAVFLVPILFIRLFAPPQFLPGVLLFCVTFALIMGYSWIDGHLPVVGNPGIGWKISWKRFLQVMIGSAASFIIMMLPPKSGRKAVRLRNAGMITVMSTLYADIISAWISSDSQSQSHGKYHAHDDDDEKQPLARDTMNWVPGLREKLLGLAAQMQAVKMQTAFAKWEGNVRGVWPGDEYMRLEAVQSDMMTSLALLGGALAQVDPQMRLEFLQHTRVVNPNFIADVMATFALVAQALRTGEPIPQAFHVNLFDRMHYHGDVGHHSYSYTDISHDDMHKHHFASVTKYEYMFYATAVAAVFQILDGLNELRTITTRLCGEVPLQGYARWKEEYDRAHVQL